MPPALQHCPVTRRSAPRPPHTAVILNNLDGLLRTDGKLGAARPLSERALRIEEATLGPDHPDVAAILSSLGELLKRQGQFDQARHVLRRALPTWQRMGRRQEATVFQTALAPIDRPGGRRRGRVVAIANELLPVTPFDLRRNSGLGRVTCLRTATPALARRGTAAVGGDFGAAPA